MVEHLTPIDALKHAIEHVGSQAAFARVCGVTQAAVWKWISGGKPLPPQHVIAVETATGVSRHQLRPDIYPRDTIATGSSCPGGLVSDGAPVVACDRGAVLHPTAGRI